MAFGRQVLDATELELNLARESITSWVKALSRKLFVILEATIATTSKWRTSRRYCRCRTNVTKCPTAGTWPYRDEVRMR